VVPRLSVFVTEFRDIRRAVDTAVGAEELGLHGAWFPSVLGLDVFATTALAAGATRRIQIGTAVVALATRPPLVLAQQAATVQAVARGRFRLGVGLGHPAVLEHVLGAVPPYSVASAEDRLAALRGLLGPEPVLGPAVTGGTPVRVWLGALSPRLAALGGALADGVVTWLAPAGYLSRVVLPAVAQGAWDEGRATPPVVAAVPVTLSTDREAVRAAAAREFGLALRLPAFRRMLRRAGVLGEAPPGTGVPALGDRLLDAMVLWGDEDTLAAKLEAFAAAGVAEVAVAPFGTGPDPDADVRRTMAALAGLTGSRAPEGDLKAPPQPA
jgi:alkanesulfonate monooxygenase SsuD/methylene tetrahydromethanopterin reductase-like flavin-dependent oxidoreductase (luciferase family)